MRQNKLSASSNFPDPERLTVILATAESEKKLGQDIRQKVFVQEQGVPPEREIDGHDEGASHYLALLGNAPIGTARSRPLEDGSVKIERVSIIKELRGYGWGHILMEKILRQVLKQGHHKALIHAQVAVAPFYERLNFTAVGSEFIEAGIKHIEMVASIEADTLTKSSV